MMCKGSLFIAATLLSSCYKQKDQPVAPLPVMVGVVSAQLVRQVWHYSGEVRPRTEVRLAFKQAGYVVSLCQVHGVGGSRDIQAGDRVVQNIILATVRPSELRAALIQQQGALTTGKGQLEAALADQRKADLAFDRAKVLYAAKAMTKPDYDSSVAAAQQAHNKVLSSQGQVETAEGQLRLAQINLGDTALRSPLTGVIETKDVERGTLVSAGTQAFTLGDMRVPKVVFGVPDTVIPQIKMGITLPVVIEGVGEEPLSGRVTGIGALADSDSRIFNIELSLDNHAGALKVGMIANVAIQQLAGSRSVPVIPVDALITAQSGTSAYSVYVVSHEDGKEIARLRSVRVGESINRSVAVEQGLQPGEQIVLERTSQLEEGRIIRMVNQEKPDVRPEQ